MEGPLHEIQTYLQAIPRLSLRTPHNSKHFNLCSFFILLLRGDKLVALTARCSRMVRSLVETRVSHRLAGVSVIKGSLLGFPRCGSLALIKVARVLVRTLSNLVSKLW